MWGITVWASLIELSYHIKLKNIRLKYYTQNYNFATYVSGGITCITHIRNQYLHSYHLIVLSFFEEFFQFCFARGNFV